MARWMDGWMADWLMDMQTKPGDLMMMTIGMAEMMMMTMMIVMQTRCNAENKVAAAC